MVRLPSSESYNYGFGKVGQFSSARKMNFFVALTTV
jgi:hypothetical protein